MESKKNANQTNKDQTRTERYLWISNTVSDLIDNDPEKALKLLDLITFVANKDDLSAFLQVQMCISAEYIEFKSGSDEKLRFLNYMSDAIERRDFSKIMTNNNDGGAK